MLGALTGKKFESSWRRDLPDLLFIFEDVVDATIELALAADPGTSWHISTNESISIKNLVKKICDKTNVDFDEIVNVSEERLGKDLNYLLDSSNLRNKF